MELEEMLLGCEHELAAGDGDTYRRLLVDDAVVVVPGQTMDKDTTAQAMDASPGWDDLRFTDERCRRLGDDAALLTYRFWGRRGEEFEYAALMASVYVRTPDGWRMTFHQQTPVS